MANIERNTAVIPADGALIRADGGALATAEAAAIDAGLRAYLLHVYAYMIVGFAVTGVAAFGVCIMAVTDDPHAAAKVFKSGAAIPARLAGDVYLTQFGYAIFATPLKWLVILAPLGPLFSPSVGFERMRPALVQACFWFYAALIGVSLGTVFLAYTNTSIVRVFFVAAISFGALSLWGYTTRRDLTGAGSFLLMGLFGVVLAGAANLVMPSSALQWGTSGCAVLVFSGLTAWETQRLKSEYIYAAMDGEVAERRAVLGALSLYLNFVNLFAILLELCGHREE